MIFFLYASAFLVAVSILIIVHEFGHFLIARLFEVRVERFSIGFGKPLYTWKSKNGFTKYTLAPFIFGGYVKLLDTRETKTFAEDYSFAFDHKPILQRLAIIAAGPFANIVFAFFAFWLMFVIGFKLPKPVIGEIVSHSVADYAGMRRGEEIFKVDGKNTDNWGEVTIAMLSRVGDEGNLNITTSRLNEEKIRTYQLNLSNWKIDSYNPDPLLDFGIKQYKPLVSPIIYEVSKNSPAEKVGLQKRDCILAIDGRKINDWEEFLQAISLYPEKTIKLLIGRGTKNIDFTVTTGWKFGKGWKKIGFMGVGIDVSKIIWPEQMLREYRYNIFSALPVVWHQMKLFVELNNIIFGKLFTGKMSLRILGGPIATFAASGQALEHGFVTFLGFLAMISLTLALINLLPLPALDGGCLVLLVFEAIMRRPISIRTQTLIFRLGIALFILLILQTTANDLMRMFLT